MESDIKAMNENIMKLRRDVDLIKNILMSEGELSEYAKKELAKARKENIESYTSLNDLRKEIEDDL